MNLYDKIELYKKLRTNDKKVFVSIKCWHVIIRGISGDNLVHNLIVHLVQNGEAYVGAQEVAQVSSVW